MNRGDVNDDRPLSDAAAKRRDAILADAFAAADRRRRGRAVRRAAGAAAFVCLLAVGALAVVSRIARPPGRQTPVAGIVPRPTDIPAPIRTPSTAPDTPRVIVQIIPSDHVERRWQVIDDDQLIAALADAGKPGGVAELNGKAVVVPVQ